MFSPFPDFKKAKSLLSVKYPSLYQQFFADFNNLLNGNKHSEAMFGPNEDEYALKNNKKSNLDSLMESDDYFDSIFPDVRC